MADYAATSCIIYTCPPEKAVDAHEILTENFENIDWCEAPGDEIQYGVCYTAQELAVGNDMTVARMLLDLGCTGEVHQDAKYEFDATTNLFAPDLGMYSSTSVNDGTPVLTADEINEAVLLTATREELVQELHRRTGKLWTDRFDAIRELWKEHDAVPSND